jgi:hypothetical protein
VSLAAATGPARALTGAWPGPPGRCPALGERGGRESRGKAVVGLPGAHRVMAGCVGVLAEEGSGAEEFPGGAAGKRAGAGLCRKPARSDSVAGSNGSWKVMPLEEVGPAAVSEALVIITIIHLSCGLKVAVPTFSSSI